jgi:hypothetical protein
VSLAPTITRTPTQMACHGRVLVERDKPFRFMGCCAEVTTGPPPPLPLA